MWAFVMIFLPPLQKLEDAVEDAFVQALADRNATQKIAEAQSQQQQKQQKLQTDTDSDSPRCHRKKRAKKECAKVRAASCAMSRIDRVSVSDLRAYLSAIRSTCQKLFAENDKDVYERVADMRLEAHPVRQTMGRFAFLYVKTYICKRPSPSKNN